MTDEEKRKKYDQYGHAAFDPNAGFGGGGFCGFDFGDLGDLFGSLAVVGVKSIHRNSFVINHVINYWGILGLSAARRQFHWILIALFVIFICFFMQNITTFMIFYGYIICLFSAQYSCIKRLTLQRISDKMKLILILSDPHTLMRYCLYNSDNKEDSQ